MMKFCVRMYLRTAKTLLNFKVIGQGHRIRFSDTLALQDRIMLLVTPA